MRNNLDDLMPQVPVLVIEAEEEIQKLLALALKPYGYKISITESGEAGVEQAKTLRPELIILGLSLTDMPATEVVQKIRESSTVPIILLSAREQTSEKIKALEYGADDYLVKPFSIGDLLARMKTALRHLKQHKANKDDVFRCGKLMVDQAKRHVTMNDSDVNLSAQEYQLLCVLVKNAGRVVTYAQLLNEVWGKESPENSNHLRVQMQHIRQKLKDDPLKPKYLITEPGIGYRLKIDG